ncbi:MAG: isopentenyl-diphosphate Delta-isomerase [Pseudomonadota bacterium]
MTTSDTKIMIPAWVEGKLTPIEKLEAHVLGLRHKAISVFVMDGDDLLIQRRAMGKYHTPGLWANTCCTHPYWGENALDCACRRLNEELGITGLQLDARDRIEYRADVPTRDGAPALVEHELVDIFVAEAARDRFQIRPNPDEVMDYRWVSRATLTAEIAETPDQFTPWLRIYLTEHSDQIFERTVAA